MRRQLKLIAAVVLVLFVVSGFSPARSSSGGGGKSRSSSGGSGGGGCSNDKSRSHNSSDYDVDDYDYDDGGGYDDSGHDGGAGGYSPTPTASDGPTARVVECASRFRKKAEVRVESSSVLEEEYRVSVTFYGKRGTRVDSATETFTLPSDGSVTVDVPMDRPGRAVKVKRCEITSLGAA